MKQLSIFLIHQGHVGRLCQLPSVREVPSVTCFCNTSKCRSRITPFWRDFSTPQTTKVSSYPCRQYSLVHSCIRAWHSHRGARGTVCEPETLPPYPGCKLFLRGGHPRPRSSYVAATSFWESVLVYSRSCTPRHTGGHAVQYASLKLYPPTWVANCS